MNIRKVKTVMITALALLAIYQVGTLWFVHITGRNIIPYFSAFFDPATPAGYAYITRPSRVIIGNGDGRFDIRYGKEITAANDALGDMLRRGAFSRQTDAESALLAALQGPVVLFEYDFPMRSEVFTLAFNRRNAAMLTNQNLFTFNAIAIASESVIFFSGERAWVYTKPAGGFMPYVEIDSALYFVNAAQAGYEGVGADVFLPRTERGWVHRPLFMFNPYANRSGEVQLDSVNARVAHFFDNPAVRNLRMVDNVITISAINTVVRYLPGNILEYNCFRPIRRGSPPDFITDFSAALAFVNADPNVSNEFYLVGYEQRGRTFVFWFNFVVGGAAGGFPLLIPEGGWGSAVDPLPAPIEVVVDHGRVSRYRKVVYNFMPDMSGQIILSADELAWEADEDEYIIGVTLGFPPRPHGRLEMYMRLYVPLEEEEDEEL